jgi:hypothetical protein
MFVLLTLNYDGLPVIYQGETIEKLQHNLEAEYHDWEEYADFLANHLGITFEEVISLWIVTPTGNLERVHFDIITKPRIVLAY